MIGNTLKRLRKDRGYSLRMLAKLSRLSHSFISDIENGRCNPSIDSLCRIADALNVEPHIFLNNMVVRNDQPTAR
jgi:transcriptional regulator with XRE-family HTH domain